MTAFNVILVVVAAINVVTFFAYGIDKFKARHDKWRIPEATLLWFAFFGGALGAFLGMRVFHHKTQHKKFTVLVPLLLVAQLALIVWALVKIVK